MLQAKPNPNRKRIGDETPTGHTERSRVTQPIYVMLFYFMLFYFILFPPLSPGCLWLLCLAINISAVIVPVTF